MSRLAQRYAKALFEVAHAASSVDEVCTDLDRLSAALSVPANAARVMSPETGVESRGKIVGALLGESHELTEKAVGVVLQRRREAILGELAAAFGDLRRESRGEALGVVETAKPLDDTGLQELTDRASKLAGKKVSLSVKDSPELIGGVKIRIGNTLYDGSVASVIEDLERALMDVPL